MPKITTRHDFHQRYWLYFLLLEKDFLQTERYLAIDEINFKSFSNEYIKQYQTICSEIDVVAKSYCKEIDSKFKGSTINTYCKCIIDSNPDFVNRAVKLKGTQILLHPWNNWTYSLEAQNDGKTKITSCNPEWWHMYNKIKHSRTSVNQESGLPYYKFANLENVVNALAALYQMELYYYRLLRQNHFPDEPDMPGPQSRIFEVENWDNLWVMTAENMGFLKAKGDAK